VQHKGGLFIWEWWFVCRRRSCFRSRVTGEE